MLVPTYNIFVHYIKQDITRGNHFLLKKTVYIGEFEKPLNLKRLRGFLISFFRYKPQIRTCRPQAQSSALFCLVTRRESPASPCTGRGRLASAGVPWDGPRLCGPRPCSGSLHPPQAAVACAAIPVRRPKPHGERAAPITPYGNLPRANQQSTGLLVPALRRRRPVRFLVRKHQNNPPA